MEKLLKIKSELGNLAAVLHVADPHRIVILSHGFTGTKCESGRLFVQTARALAAAGISALRFDFWGSGDSEGEFDRASPNTEIADLKRVIHWARSKGYAEIGLLGLSLGGAVSICTAAQCPEVKTLVTWSALPKFQGWANLVLGENDREKDDPLLGGTKFVSDLPPIDVPEAYVSLNIPKLQIQGDNDIPGFVEGFKEYFPDAPAPKKHVILPGASHVFSEWPKRKKAIQLTVSWFLKHLVPLPA